MARSPCQRSFGPRPLPAERATRRRRRERLRCRCRRPVESPRIDAGSPRAGAGEQRAPRRGSPRLRIEVAGFIGHARPSATTVTGQVLPAETMASPPQYLAVLDRQPEDRRRGRLPAVRRAGRRQLHDRTRPRRWRQRHRRATPLYFARDHRATARAHDHPRPHELPVRDPIRCSITPTFVNGVRAPPRQATRPTTHGRRRRPADARPAASAAPPASTSPATRPTIASSCCARGS